MHELRALAHVIDMHQLSKDPSMPAGTGVATPSSPVRTMSHFELVRYLDYCSEMLSLTGKLAALYVQSFDDDALERIGRVHDARAAHRAIEMAQAAGLTAINVDLMYGLPGQTLAGAVADVDAALAFGVPHLSHYELTIEPEKLDWLEKNAVLEEYIRIRRGEPVGAPPGLTRLVQPIAAFGSRRPLHQLEDAPAGVLKRDIQIGQYLAFRHQWNDPVHVWIGVYVVQAHPHTERAECFA